MKQKTASDSFGIIGLVFGILSIVTVPFVSGAAFVMAVLGIIFSVVQERKHSNRMSTMGLVISIIGLVASIISFVVLFFLYLGVFSADADSSLDFGSSSYNESLKQYARENFEKLVEEDLTELHGYEVISVGLLGEGLNKSTPYLIPFLNMKALGNRKEQVLYGFIILSGRSDVAGYSSNVQNYMITILSPTNECIYSIDGDIYRAFMMASNGEKIYSTDGTEVDSRTLYDLIKLQIETSERCS